MSTWNFTEMLAKAVWPLLLIGIIALLLIIKDILGAIGRGYKNHVTRVKREPTQISTAHIAGDNGGVQEQGVTHSLHSAEN